jgi:hypothetical protein
VQEECFALYGVGVENLECTRERRIRQSVLTVGKNVKFLSSLMVADRCTAENAMLSEDRLEDIKPDQIEFFASPLFLPLITIRRMHILG